MKIYKRIAATVMAVAAAVNILSVQVFAAPVFKDVPSTHWAYSYISAVADRGLMLGDTSANFRPDELIDKFDTAKILARSAGYKYENISAAEQDYYNKCYEKNKTFLAQYSAKFSKWNTSADREISFLLEKEILTAADLNQFVILDDAGREQLRALSRGESAVFITKLIGKNAEATAINPTNLFKDDARISVAVRPYVYYLRGIKVISGDTEGNFNPNGAVSRAAMAVMLSRALDLVSAPAASTPTTSQGVSTITTVSGTVDTYYANLNAVQIVVSTGEKKIYRLTASASVYVDGYLKTGADLRSGMVMSGVLNNEELISIQAQNTAPTTPVVSTPVTTPTSTPTPSATVQYTTLDGTVSTVEQNGSVRTIGIEVKTLSPRDGSIITDTRTLTLDIGCKITRSGDVIQFAEIARGDIATAQIAGNTLYELELEERILTLKDAMLEEKRYNETTGLVTFSVLGPKNKRYELRLAANTTISRKSVGTTTWDQIRVGDMLDLTAEYGILRDLVAYGVLSTVDGWIESIHIANNYQSYITFRDSYGEVHKYFIIPEATDIYSLRVGNHMRLRLDSQEISTVMLLDEANFDVVTGYVSSVRSGNFVLTNAQPYGTNGKRTVEVDSKTIYTNSKTGEKVNYSSLREGQKVYVVFQNNLSTIARTVTILTE